MRVVHAPNTVSQHAQGLTMQDTTNTLHMCHTTHSLLVCFLPVAILRSMVMLELVYPWTLQTSHSSSRRCRTCWWLSWYTRDASSCCM